MEERETPLTAEFVRESVRLRRYELSLHADDERLDEGLTIHEIEEALGSAVLLEDYPDDPRGHSCLVLGHVHEKPVHFVCGLSRQRRLIVITVYCPAMPKWKDERTRSE